MPAGSPTSATASAAFASVNVAERLRIFGAAPALTRLCKSARATALGVLVAAGRDGGFSFEVKPSETCAQRGGCRPRVLAAAARVAARYDQRTPCCSALAECAQSMPFVCLFHSFAGGRRGGPERAENSIALGRSLEELPATTSVAVEGSLCVVALARMRLPERIVRLELGAFHPDDCRTLFGALARLCPRLNRLSLMSSPLAQRLELNHDGRDSKDSDERLHDSMSRSNWQNTIGALPDGPEAGAPTWRALTAVELRTSLPPQVLAAAVLAHLPALAHLSFVARSNGELDLVSLIDRFPDLQSLDVDAAAGGIVVPEQRGTSALEEDPGEPRELRALRRLRIRSWPRGAPSCGVALLAPRLRVLHALFPAFPAGGLRALLRAAPALRELAVERAPSAGVVLEALDGCATAGLRTLEVEKDRVSDAEKSTGGAAELPAVAGVQRLSLQCRDVLAAEALLQSVKRCASLRHFHLDFAAPTEDAVAARVVPVLVELVQRNQGSLREVSFGFAAYAAIKDAGALEPLLALQREHPALHFEYRTGWKGSFVI